ncbi:YveK family protein [Halalkalibacillus halophilus]|uniref:YveK family protein n=1 Tax=Halalkalibacillus halophilus TaxID=392827 RepID=UPI0003FAFD2D|nr:Wzz/FepE/Etk N-terminal domain-containing protein [Halalkalibacillus halophilus]
MEETISLQEIWQIIKKRLNLIILITITAMLISFIVTTFVMTPQYEANSQFIVNEEVQSEQQITQGDIRTNVELINTYNVVLQSPAILNVVVEELGLEMSSGQLANKINVSNAENSQVVNVQVVDADHALAVEIANTTVDVFREDIPNYMNVDNVGVLSEAAHDANPSQVSPNPTLNVAIALVLGLMIGIGLAFLLEYLDTSIKNEEDIEKALDLPVMGVISTFQTDRESYSSKRNR